MKNRDRFLPIFLLSLTLSAPTVLGAATAEASVKDKSAKKDKPSPQYVRQNDRWDDQDDWDDWNDDWDDDDANLRFEGMDTNRDGRVTRSEWRGNDRSFDNHDWNRDGVLSGNELRPGQNRGQNRENRTWNDTWNERFERLDRNNNGYISTSEWTRDQRLFDRLDVNNDNRLSRSELMSLARQRQASWDQQFTEMDVNRDGRLSRREWQRDDDLFERLDRNNDGYIVRTELVSRDFDRDDDRNTSWDQRFTQMDVNRDGRLSQREWQSDRDAFERLDRNNDGYVTRTELVNRDFDRDNDRNDDRDYDRNDNRTEPYPRNEERFQHFDRNRDRLLSLSEWTGSRELFDRLDRDNNGYLSITEWMGR
ncbi:MAG TPA: hypothetical protein VKM72_05380 [Thermoanaerobaculia bacterium]|nr:hypothetical protein [Thermoanaerobaculia bacterium]